MDERYVERYIDGTYSYERHADGWNHLGERFVERSSTARTLTSGTRAAQARAEHPAAVH